MIFADLYGPQCVKCKSYYDGISTLVRRDGRYVALTICEECLFRTVIGPNFDREVNRAMGEVYQTEMKQWAQAKQPAPWWAFWR